MLVNLRRDWFGPNATLYEANSNPHEFPMDWEKLIPKGAEIVGRGIVGSDKYDEKAKLKEPTVALKDADDPRVDGLTAGNAPKDAPMVIKGTENLGSTLTTAQGDKVSADMEKAAQDGTAPVGARPRSSPQVEQRQAALGGSTGPLGKDGGAPAKTADKVALAEADTEKKESAKKIDI